MLRTVLTLAPYLLAAPVVAAPAVVAREPCKDAVTEIVHATATVIAGQGQASSALVEQHSPQHAQASVAVSVHVVATPQASPAISAASAQQSAVRVPTSNTPATNNTTPQPNHARGYSNSLYFTNWFVSLRESFKKYSQNATNTVRGIYGANMQPQQIPAGQVTRILYAFADIASDGEVKSSDTYADIEKHYPTDSWNDQGKNVYGVIKQMYLLKKQNRHLKILLSIGGWTYSPKFPPVAASEAGRQRFASSATKLVADWGFDGIDIDWEYPANPNEARDFVLLLQACRQSLDQYAAQHAPGYHFLITVASPAGAKNYNNMDMKGMDPYVDAWNLMAYDYAGSWDSTSGHQANIFANPGNEQATKFSTEQAVHDYAAKGIAMDKIMLGMPLYGRSFEATPGLGQTYNGVGSGSIQSGVWLYKDLPRAGASESYDDVAGASYSYDPATKELISYDNINSVTRKSNYLTQKGLGGAVFWEASGDRAGAQSLVGTVASRMGRLDEDQNLLSFPASIYDNMRAGMPGA